MRVCSFADTETFLRSDFPMRSPAPRRTRPPVGSARGPPHTLRSRAGAGQKAEQVSEPETAKKDSGAGSANLGNPPFSTIPNGAFHPFSTGVPRDRAAGSAADRKSVV